jgi:HSP20 family molecular chaperone IbpA
MPPLPSFLSMPSASELPLDSSTPFNFDFPLDPPPTEAERLTLSAVSEKYNRDGSVELDHMDPYFYMAESHIADPHPVANAFLPHFKSPHFHRHAMQILSRYLHYPGHSTANDEGGPDQKSHEYFNLPAVDIRTTAHDYYFDIELPGVTDKAGISIHWTSSHGFIVEGEIPRPRISIRDELNDDDTIEGSTDATGETIDPPIGLVSLSGVPTHKPTNTLINEGVTNNEDTLTKRRTTIQPKDKYPGFSHLVRCPGSGESSDANAPTKWASFDAIEREDDNAEAPEPTFVPDEFSIPTAKHNHPPPLDEVALLRSRTNSSKASSHHHKPHNDRDVPFPSARGFSFRSNHNEHQSPLPLVSPNPFDFSAPALASDNDQSLPCQAAYTSSNPPSYFPNAAGPQSKTSSLPPSFRTHRHLSNSHTSGDILRPVVENRNTPQLVLAERMIGRYKRQCVLPGDMEPDQKGTSAKLEAGVLTVRVPRRKDKGELQEEGVKVVVK